ncbi:unnamed protein product [Candidula unifasciata]|uniref:tRNA (adenine(58)-N(1))-methyltransferase non-catalytic subunit TRM6 n=1 Tax=Candidula unifasciata TaxID=100452 RepID=A0A8S4A9A5_9EUPU|nr:unnamed protein product [Candidula unifasciata]
MTDIQEGDHVVFKRDGLSRVYQMRRNREVYFERSKFKVDDLIGQPYGSTFEIDRGKLVKFEQEKVVQLKETISSLPGADNRNLLDAESNQKMSKDDIMKMKDEGITGEKIIEELIENSETFKGKTEFSQAKYLKKKKKKHILVFTVLRPTPRLVMEIFSKEPGKICNLRPDTLSQLLNYGNVMYGSNVAVVETCQGLVLASLLQRMGGEGKLIQLVPNTSNSVCRQVMDYFNFPKEHLDNVYMFPLDTFSTITDDTEETDGNSAANLNLETSSEKTVTAPTDAASTDGGDSSIDSKTLMTVGGVLVESSDKSDQSENAALLNIPGKAAPSTDVAEANDVTMKDNDALIENAAGGEVIGGKRQLPPNRDLQRQLKLQKQKEAGQIIRNKQLDSLILACKYNPLPILMTMLEFLPPSRPVVVYCQYLEPLVECYTQIKKKGIGLQLRLSETWFREYQVLPQRTHPLMNMSGTGGYLLTFMTVQPVIEKVQS